jgi:hypothetical protein
LENGGKNQNTNRPSFEERFQGKLSKLSIIRSTPTCPVLSRVDDGLHTSFEALAASFGAAVRRQASSAGRQLQGRYPSLQSIKSLSNSISETAKQQRRSRRNSDKAGGACHHQRMNRFPWFVVRQQARRKRVYSLASGESPAVKRSENIVRVLPRLERKRSSRPKHVRLVRASAILFNHSDHQCLSEE